MRNWLRDLVERLRAAGPRERLVALTARLEELEDDLVWLADPATPGIGRALFVPLGGGEPARVGLQAPLCDAVVLEPDAFVALDLRGGAQEVAHLSFDEATGDWREMKGPAGANPALAQQSVSQRDRFERRLDEPGTASSPRPRRGSPRSPRRWSRPIAWGRSASWRSGPAAAPRRETGAPRAWRRCWARWPRAASSAC